jgi:hypothetical protein
LGAKFAPGRFAWQEAKLAAVPKSLHRIEQLVLLALAENLTDEMIVLGSENATKVHCWKTLC